MPDYPAHLASYYLIAGGASKFYHIEWAFLPNLAGEILIPLLSKLVGLEFATRLFITMGLALWVIGPGADPARALRPHEHRAVVSLRSLPTTPISSGDS